MAASIRDAVAKVVEEKALPAASFHFGLDSVSTFDRFVVPFAPALAQVADAASTQLAINRGLVEANPFMKGAVKNMPIFWAVKVGVGALIAVQVKKQQDAGHKNRARVVSALGSAIGFGAAISNVHQMGKR